MFTAGFASRKITPEKGSDIPGLFERRKAAGVADDLFVRALVVGGDGSLVAIVQADAIALPYDVVAAVRNRAEKESEINGAHCLLAATHTHSGGPLVDLFSSPADEAYIERTVDAITAAIVEACRVRKPCVTGSAVTHAPGVAFNRRFLLKNQSHATHPGKMHPDIVRPAGPADDTVLTLGFRDAHTLRPVGCIVSFACHATHMNGLKFSADYPRWIAGTLSAAYGRRFQTVFLNAPCGDITQIDNLSPRPYEFGPYWCERTGRAVGAAALQGFATIDFMRGATVSAAFKTLRAGVRKSSRGELKLAADVLAAATPGSEDAETTFARERLFVEDFRRKNRKITMEIQAVRIADTLLWTVPGELSQEFALNVREQSPFKKTAGVSLANGYYGYICPREAYLLGGYETRLARSSMLEEDTGDRIVQTAVSLAKPLYAKAATELGVLDERRIWPSADTSPLDGIKAMKKRRF